MMSCNATGWLPQSKTQRMLHYKRYSVHRINILHNLHDKYHSTLNTNLFVTKHQGRNQIQFLWLLHTTNSGDRTTAYQTLWVLWRCGCQCCCYSCRPYGLRISRKDADRRQDLALNVADLLLTGTSQSVWRLGSRLDGSGFKFRQVQRICSSTKSSDGLSGPLSLVPIASCCPSPGLERQLRGAHQTPPSGVEVKNEWHSISITPTRLRDVSWNNLFVTCANDGRFPHFRYRIFKILFKILFSVPYPS